MRLALVVGVLTSSLCACGRGAAPASGPGAEPGAGRGFDRAAADAALSVSADAARSECQKPGQPGVQGEVKVTFAPSGAVTSSTTDAAWGGTPIGGCVLAAFRSATVPPFDGVAVTVTKSIDVP